MQIPQRNKQPQDAPGRRPYTLMLTCTLFTQNDGHLHATLVAKQPPTGTYAKPGASAVVTH